MRTTARSVRAAAILASACFVFMGVPGEGRAERLRPYVPPGGRVRFVVPRLIDAIDPGLVQTATVDLEPNVRVLEGSFRSADGDSIRVEATSTGERLAIPVGEIERMEVWSQGDYRVTGLGIGVMVGGVLGALVGHSTETSEPERTCEGEGFLCDDFTLIEIPRAVTGAIIGATVGCAFGMVIGSYSHYDRWDPVDFAHLRASVGPRPDGSLRATLTASF